MVLVIVGEHCGSVKPDIFSDQPHDGLRMGTRVPVKLDPIIDGEYSIWMEGEDGLFYRLKLFGHTWGMLVS